MSTKRKRPSGTWEYIIRRKGVLPKPLSLTFETEAEGDVYVARLEQLLDAGILPDELVSQKDQLITVEDAIRAYMKKVSLPASDADLLNTMIGLWQKEPLTKVNFQWADSWVTRMKRADNLAPSTIRHRVGALARCFDWTVKTGTPALAVNPLRLLPRRYATYTDDDAAAMVAQDLEPKEDVYRDRRPSRAEEDEVRRLLAGGKPKDRERSFELNYQPALVFLFELAIESAMRLREMFTLEPAQFDVDKRTAFLDRTKNGSKRAVPLTSVALGAYKRYVDAVSDGDPAMQGFRFESGYIFPWLPAELASAASAALPSRRALAKVTSKLSGQFGRLFDAAGCSDLVFHDLRHEATSRLYERTTLSDIQIAKITGHTDPKVLMRYANLRGSDLADRLW